MTKPCYFCNKPSIMERSDMRVPVCDEHRRTKYDTQPSLPAMEPHHPVYDCLRKYGI